MQNITEAAIVAHTHTDAEAHRYRGSHRMMPTRAPHVPGHTGRKPAPSEVDINRGRSGKRFVDPSGNFVDLRYGFAMVQRPFSFLRIVDITGRAMNGATSVRQGAKLGQSLKLTMTGVPSGVIMQSPP